LSINEEIKWTWQSCHGRSPLCRVVVAFPLVAAGVAPLVVAAGAGVLVPCAGVGIAAPPVVGVGDACGVVP
jgi:hypothetical protein